MEYLFDATDNLPNCYRRSLLKRSWFLDELLQRRTPIHQPRRRKPTSKKQPRQGNPAVTRGAGLWRIPVGEEVSTPLRRAERYDERSWDARTFMNTYGVPAKVFDEIVKEAHAHVTLRGKTHHGDGRRGPLSKSLEFKVAACLEMCQSGSLFKTMAAKYAISPQVLEVFFHKFMRLMVLSEYKKHVYPPTTRADIDRVLHLHSKLGFPGAITMFDGTKWEWGNCPLATKFAHLGKEGYPTRLYMVAGDANSMIHHVHGSHPGARNDMTASKFDEFMRNLRNSPRYVNETFWLHSANGSLVQCRGLYGITDNGFHRWRECQMPAKHGATEELRRWSKRMESVRKPGTECIYGRMKKRYRILSLPCLFDSDVKMDNTFRFIAMLHNRCQRHYGLDKLGAFDSDWKTANTIRDDERIDRENGGVPRLVNHRAMGNVVEAEQESSWLTLRDALVTHFRYKWNQGEVFWLHTAAQCRENFRTDPSTRRTGPRHESRLDSTNLDVDPEVEEY